MSARRHRIAGDEEASSWASTTPPTLHVLHVDDSPDDHLLLKAAGEMAEAPFTWDVAESADTAIFYLRTLLLVEGKGSLKWPDLVLLDITLPRGGGLRVLEFIRSTPELNSLRVVVLSGSSSPEILERAYVLGANSVLVKPSVFRELVRLAASLHTAWTGSRRLSPNVSPATESSPLMFPRER